MRVLPINTSKTSKIQHICNKTKSFFQKFTIIKFGILYL